MKNLLWVPLFWLMSFAANGDNPVVEMHTSAGIIVLELNQTLAPVTVANFLEYVEKDGYQGAIFHRVIPGFMIQTGGHFEDLTELEVANSVVNEADNGLKNKAGTIAMARMGEIDSAERQFFINIGNNTSLDHGPMSCTREDERKVAQARARGLHRPQSCKTFGYAVFGRVVGGMDVVVGIEGVATRPKGMHQNVPVQPVIIEKVVLRSREP